VVELEKKINISFRVSDERQEELKILSARRRQSIQRMIEEGLELLASSPSAADKHNTCVISSSERS
jgi:predicted transcriptional regulator